MITSKLDQILENVDQLRPMPTSVTRVLRAMDDPTVSGGMIADLIGLDQALSAAVLQMANSIGLGYDTSCAALNEAVMRLGFRRIKTILFGASSAGPLSKRLNGYRLGAGELWNHSVATAVTAQWLSQTFRYPNPEEAYVAGLLHDIGKLVLDQFVLDDYGKIVEMMQTQKMPLWEVEEQSLGIHHAEVGSLMAKKWHFPMVLVDAIQYHHAPSLAQGKPELPAIINIANSFTSQREMGLADLYSSVVHPETLNILHLEENRLDKLQKAVSDYITNGHS